MLADRTSQGVWKTHEAATGVVQNALLINLVSLYLKKKREKKRTGWGGKAPCNPLACYVEDVADGAPSPY